ncbi:MAG: hypothetical protein ACYC28_07375 [Longimicrobiales bacterium]
MRTRSIVAISCIALAGCTPASDGDAEAPADTLTQQQRDSAIGASGLPGAGAVNRALDASRTAEERAARIDSIQP